MDERDYYNVTLPEAAQQFGVRGKDVRFLVQRSALEAQYHEGQWWVHLGPRRGENTVVRLWHGTSQDRIDWIVEHGFRTETRGKQVWFSTREVTARIHAIGRARQRHSIPVLVGCEVDLERYPIFWKPTRQVYVFHQPLGPEVITSVQEVDEREQSRRFRMQIRKRARCNLVNVRVTKNAGAPGILFWINPYLDRHGLEPVTIENTIVRDIIEWMEREYREGRDDSITEEELEARTVRLLESGQGGSNSISSQMSTERGVELLEEAFEGFWERARETIHSQPSHPPARAGIHTAQPPAVETTPPGSAAT